MKINFAHLCDYALVADGKLSVLGIFDQIRPQAIPWTHPTFYIAYELGLEPAEVGTTIKARIAMQDEDGGHVLAMDGQINTHGKAKIGDTPAVRQVIGLNGVEFKREGPYQVLFWLQGNLAHTLRFEVAPLDPTQSS